MDKVVLKYCDNYTEAAVDAALADLFAHLAPLPELAGKTVFLKVNLVLPKKPEGAATTHPIVAKSLAKYFLALGAQVIVGDSPGGPNSLSYLKYTYRVCGLTEVFKDMAVTLLEDMSSIMLEVPQGKVLKQIEVVKAMAEADFLVSVGKLKTHSVTIMTGATKNMFGTLPGLVKTQQHFNIPDHQKFAELLVDVARTITPHLAIIDGIIGMEGNGPSGGNPRGFNVLLGSRSCYNADIVAAKILGLEPQRVPMLKNCLDLGLAQADPAIEGDQLDRFVVSNIKMPEVKTPSFYQGRVPKWLERWLDNRTMAYPGFGQSQCNGCQACKNACPAGAITMTNQRPVLDAQKCIKCFCCHEMCPRDAVDIQKPKLSQIFRIGK